jgi:hypothetical protein
MNTSIVFVICAFVLLIILLILYFYYYYLPSQSNIYKYQIPLLSSEIIFNEDYSQTILMTNLITTRPTLSVPKLGYGITFKWDMYIPNLSGNDKWHKSFNLVKPLFTMGDSPQVGYNPKQNNLSIITKYRDNPFYAQFSEIKFPDLKQQKWCTYVVVISGRNIQLWIDGKIVKTEYLPSLPVIYDIQSSITIGQKNNNFLGKIKNLIMYPYPLSYTEIQSIL